jgi:transposase
MAYSINPNLPKARAIALKLLLIEELPLLVVANRCGVHRTTLWRWKKKWDEINKNISEGDYANRPGRLAYKKVKLNISYHRWSIPTDSS